MDGEPIADGSASDPAVGLRLAAIEARIAAACDRAGRERSAVTLVGASKTQPVSRLAAAHGAGLRHFGENRVQEGVAKAGEVPPDCVWHLLGPLQSNKVRPAVRTFTVFHAVDRESIARELDREAAKQGRKLEGLLEINLGAEASKHGFDSTDLARVAAPLATLAHLEIRGLMAIPPPGETPEASRPWFRRLAALRAELDRREEWSGRLVHLSMGMSDDFEVAIEEGATFVRVGTALFGARG